MTDEREQKLILLESFIEKFVDGKAPKEKSEIINTDFKREITVGGEVYDSCVQIYYPDYDAVIVTLFGEETCVVKLRPMLKGDFDNLVNRIMILPTCELTDSERSIRFDVERMGLPLL